MLLEKQSHLIFFLLLSTISPVFIGCKSTSKKEYSTIVNGDSIKQKSKIKKTSIEPISKSDKEIEVRDSLCLIKALKDALELAEANVHKGDLLHNYENVTDSSYTTYINITLGNLFSKNQKHLIIKREIPSVVLTDIFLHHDKKFIPIFHHEQGGMTYRGDTIRDVNGDKQNDYVINWYPSAGCCARNISNVYLYHKDTKRLSESYEFINPTFSSSEKIIRGVLYGHPGEVGLYKYRWNNFKIDTIEFIYPDQSDTIDRWFIKTDKKLYSTKDIKKHKIKLVPKEYHKIESFEWFYDY